jgi:hypothetical protein
MVKFQVIQPDSGLLSLNVVSDPLDENDKSNLIRLICEKLGPMEITVNNVKDIPADKSGKFRAVISGRSTSGA